MLYFRLFVVMLLINNECKSQNDTIPKVVEPGIICSGEFESHPCFTADGNTLYFVKSTPNFDFWTICVSKKLKGKWTIPEIAPFSGRYSDADPFITRDGKHFYFISNRPINVKEKYDLDIWVMDWNGNEWGQPKNIGAPINSNKNEWFPTVSSLGNIFFGSEREGGKGACDIYSAKWLNNKFTDVKSLGDSVNTRFNEFEPFISDDEQFIIYMASNPGGFGGSDLYISFNDNGWTKGKNLGAPFNSASNEYSPNISKDGKQFYWASTRITSFLDVKKKLSTKEYKIKLNAPGNGLGDIYQISIEALKKLISKNSPFDVPD